MELNTGPCQDWPIKCESFPDDLDPEIRDFAISAATEVLWHRTKRRFGLCEVTLRPCKRECFPHLAFKFGNILSPTQMSWPFPFLHDGTWINLACGFCGDNCSCTTISDVILPYPVASISEVKIDGEVFDSENYLVVNHRSLIRTDGGEWPRCNDISQTDDHEGTWSVTANYGEAVPTLGQLAAGQLASAIAKACVGANDCPLPTTTIRQVQRQGVTKVFFDANTAFQHGKIGLYYPDLFIHTYNPTNTGIATVFDIDGQRRQRVTTAPGEMS